ncbi:MAG: AI-2E family transporter [Proteobacteria bacterium]|nr:AI-2E family transporter [Pseudomonadota bacterium]
MNEQESNETGSAMDAEGPDGLTATELMGIMLGMMPFAVTGLALLAFLYTAYFAAELFLPVFFAVFLTIILRPLVRSMKRIGIPQVIGALIILFCLIGLLAGATARLSTPAEQWLQRLPSIQREIEAKLWPVKRSIEQAQEATEKIQDLADGKNGSTRNQEVTVKESSLLSRAFETTWFTIVQGLIILALTFFFLAQDIEKTRKAIRKLPLREHRASIEDIFEAVQATITRFLQISAVIYVSLGPITALAMYLLGMPNPVMWGILAMVLGFTPYVGPLIVFGCITVVSLLSFDDWWQVLAPPLVYGGLTVVEGYFITPTVLGRHLTVSPIAVFLSMLLWTWVWGMAGALLAVPILVVVMTTAQHLTAILRKPRQSRPDGKHEITAADPVS